MTVDQRGWVRAMAGGSAEITAAAGTTASAVAGITAVQVPHTVVLSEPPDSLAVGDSIQLTAQAFDALGSAIADVTFEWSSSDTTIAAVTQDGWVDGRSAGSVEITVRVGDLSAFRSLVIYRDPDHPDERAALEAFYHATNGPEWKNNTNWLSDNPVGHWHGVETDDGGNVVGLNFNNNGLRGRLPAELADLSNLKKLFLWGEWGGEPNLTGPIPPELGNIGLLRHVALHSNQLSGPIPQELGRLAHLRTLVLSGNALTGPIPVELGNTSLRTLWLSDNKLTGPIPPELGKLKDLDSFLLDVNPGLRGEIPTEVLALPLERHFQSYATGLCVPRNGDFDSYTSRHGWIGHACGEAEPGFQIELVFDPDVPGQIREAMRSQAEYWMEILRDTEAPDLFGVRRYHSSDWPESRPDLIDDIVVTVRLADRAGAALSGLTDLFRHRIPYQGGILFRAADATNTRWLDLIARNQLGHTLGIGSLWDIRGLLKNKSRAGEVRDTYVVSPLAQEAFDAAGGASYKGPKVPVHQHGGGRNSNWRADVFGSELMSWGWSDHVPTSAVTLQALADLGYKVDLSLADPYTLPETAAAAALGADEPTLDLRWGAPSTVVVCRPQDDLLRELEILRPGLPRLRHARFRPCQSAQATPPAPRSFPVPLNSSKIQLSRPPDS